MKGIKNEMVRVSFWRIFFVVAFAVFFGIFSLVLNVSADEIESVGSNEADVIGLVPAEIQFPSAEIAVDTDEDLHEISGTRSLIGVYPVSVVSPVEPSDTNGFKAVILALFGDYDPIVCEYAYTNTNGYVSYVREITPDYIWLVSAGIFAIVIFCLFKLIGVIMKHG